MDISRLSLFGRRSPTAREVSRGGRPAAALPHGGMPAYESETGALLVMENLVVAGPSLTHTPMALPASYMMACIRTQGDGMTALHDDPDAIWSWRPLLYSLGWVETQRLGSQHELEYRRGLWEVGLAQSDLQDAVDRLGKRCIERGYPPERYMRIAHWMVDRWTYPEQPRVAANARAKRLLREHLAPQQLLDLDALAGFFVRGTINRLYYVDVGNGFDIVDPVTHQHKVSLCLHPDDWMPYEDVALAIKLGIDGGKESEAELLEAARPRLIRQRSWSLAEERAAHRLEERFRFYP